MTMATTATPHLTFDRPDTDNQITTERLLDLFEHPAQAGRLGDAARRHAFGPKITIRPCDPLDQAPTAAVLDREAQRMVLAAWPEPQALRSGDRIVITVGSSADDRRRFLEYIQVLANTAPSEIGLAPCSPTAAGLHRLWCIAAARVLLPATVRVEARHDLIGIRLAQLAVGFGADTFAGPVEPDRILPLAGVTRPNEATASGIATLIRQVGLQPA